MKRYDDVPDFENIADFICNEIKDSGFETDENKFRMFQYLFILPMMYPKGNPDFDVKSLWEEQNSDDGLEEEDFIPVKKTKSSEAQGKEKPKKSLLERIAEKHKLGGQMSRGTKLKQKGILTFNKFYINR